MPWAWLAIVFGLLIIVTRAPLIFRPTETLALARSLWATNTRARALGTVYLALAVACFMGAAELGGSARQLLYLASLVLLGLMTWPLAAPAHFRRVIDRYILFVEESVDTAALRALGLLAVSFGGLLVWWGVRAL